MWKRQTDPKVFQAHAPSAGATQGLLPARALSVWQGLTLCLSNVQFLLIFKDLCSFGTLSNLTVSLIPSVCASFGFLCYTSSPDPVPPVGASSQCSHKVSWGGGLSAPLGTVFCFPPSLAF